VLYLLKKIRTAKAGVRYDIPVGILTGASDQKIVSLSMMLDCDAFLVKPVSKAQLIERVERLRNRMGRKLPAPESYNHLLVGDPHDVDTIPDPSALPSSETVGAQQVRKTVNTLTVGMVLAENLLSSEDSLIVPAKTVITDALLILLRDLDNVTPLKPVAVVA
jgi:DNA-binding response OmpR family regulator